MKIKRFNKIKKIILFICIFCIPVIFLLGCENRTDQATKPLAKEGILDFSNWDFNKNPSIALNGKWEFYWHQFLKPEDFKSSIVLNKTSFITVPSSWGKSNISGFTPPGKGYATYRLLLKGINNNTEVAIKIGDLDTAYKIWIDGIFRGGVGVVSTNEKESGSVRNVKIFSFHPTGEYTELVVHVSNYFETFHYKTGML